MTANLRRVCLGFLQVTSASVPGHEVMGLANIVTVGDERVS